MTGKCASKAKLIFFSGTFERNILLWWQFGTTKKALYFTIDESNMLDAYIHHDQIYVEYINDLTGFHQNLHVIWSCLTIYFFVCFPITKLSTIKLQWGFRFRQILSFPVFPVPLMGVFLHLDITTSSFEWNYETPYLMLHFNITYKWFLNQHLQIRPPAYFPPSNFYKDVF